MTTRPILTLLLIVVASSWVPPGHGKTGVQRPGLAASTFDATLVAGPSSRPVIVPAPVTAEESPAGEVGTALYTASATWCAPTPTQCQSWGGNAKLAAVNSFRFGDEPYPVRVWRGDTYVDVTVVSFCACRGTMHAIDLSPSAFRVLEPDLSRGRIDVEVEVLTDLQPHPDDERMRDEVRDLPATDAAP